MVLVLATVVALVVAGCGAGDTGDSASPSPAPVPSVDGVAVVPAAGAVAEGVSIGVTRAASSLKSPGASLIGGPVEIATSDGSQPSGPVEITFTLNPSARIDATTQLLVMHHDQRTDRWFPEPATVDATNRTITATVSSLSPFDVITWIGGIVTGNRTTSGPEGCGKAPDWIDGVLIYNGRNDALRGCLSSSGKQAVLHLLNNRGFPVTMSIGNGNPKVQVDTPNPGDAVNNLSVALAQRNPSRIVMAPGAAATLTYNQPTSGVVKVRVEAKRDGLSYWTSVMGTALGGLLSAAAKGDQQAKTTLDKITAAASGAVGAGDCGTVLGSLTTNPSPDAGDGASAITACSDQFAQYMKDSGRPDWLIDLFKKTVRALTVIDIGYKFIDGLGDQYPIPSALFDMTAPKKQKASLALAYVDKCYSGGDTLVIKPTEVATACEGSSIILNMRWSSWTATRAEGVGLSRETDCEPTCAEGQRFQYPVRVIVDRPTNTDCGRFYGRITIIYPKDFPPYFSRSEARSGIVSDFLPNYSCRDAAEAGQ